MKTFASWGALLACLFLTGCGGGGSRSALPPMPMGDRSSNDLMRVGDKITVRLSGVPDEGYFNEIQIPASGDITVGLLTGSYHAAGRTPAELAADITDAYRNQKIYTNPVVTVIQEERFVNVGGEVRGPSRVIYTSDATVMSTINSCAGFTEYANRRAVRIIRGDQVIQVDCVRAAQSPGADPPVYPGDQIYVPRTMF